MAIDFESRTVEQKQELEEYDKKLNNEYKETYARLLRKKKNNENELIVMKALKEKNTILEIKPKSRTKKQTKSLTNCNNKLTKMGKQLVENVLSKCSYLKKKPKKTVAERKRLQRNLQTDEEKEERKMQHRDYMAKICASQPDVEKERR